MGKPKQPDPEPEKIVRALGENLNIPVSEEEKKYRNKNGPDDVKDIPSEKLKCTVCTKTVSDIVKKPTEPFVHMVLGVLMCKDCSSFYGDGYFSVDEDGDDKYCRWCGQGGTLYLCSRCTCAFCKKCIKQNLSRQDVKDLESDDWKCLICNPKPLYECRTICWALQEYAQAKKNSQEPDVEEDEEESRTSRSKRSRSKKTPEARSTMSRKRKVSEIEEESEPEKERESKRRRSSDSAQETRHKGGDALSSSFRRSRTKANISKESIEEESEEEDAKPVSSKSRKSKNKKNKSEDEDLKPVTSKFKKSSEQEEKLNQKPIRSPRKKISEIVILDDEDLEEDEEIIEEDDDNSSPKKNSSRSLRAEKSKKAQKKVKSKQSNSKTKKKETPESSKKSSRHSSNKKGKNEDEEDDETEKTPVKRSQRSTKGRRSYQEDSDSASKEEKSEIKSTTSGRKSDAEEKPQKSLTLVKNAKKEVVQAGGFINSALKDVVELSNLISIRCEKLCSKTVQSTDDVLHVFSKLKQLTGAVHQNLNLIEKGLDTKITAWKNENFECTNKDSVNTNDANEKSQEEPDSNFDEEKENVLEKRDDDEEMEVEENGNGEKNDGLEEKFDHEKTETKDKMDVDSVSQENLVAEVSGTLNPKETDEKLENDSVESSEILAKGNNEESSESEETDKQEQSEGDEKANISVQEPPIKSPADETEEAVDQKQDMKVEEEQNHEVDANEDISSESKNINTEESIKEKNAEESNEKNSTEEPCEEKDTEESNEENLENTGKTMSSGKYNEEVDVENCKDAVCDKSERACLKEDRVDKNDFDSLNSNLISKNDSDEIVSRSVGAVLACDIQNNGVPEVKILNKTNSIEQGSKKQDESDLHIITERNVDKIEKEETPVKDSTQPLARQIEGLKNGSVDGEKKEKADEERKIEHKGDEKKNEQTEEDKKNENKNEDDKFSRNPSDDHKSTPRPHQSSSGDRNRHSQDSRWSGSDRDRGGWNRDRYQDRGWSGGRGGSSYHRGSDRWHQRGGGWGYHR